jgi:hypothetical protein
MLRLSVKIEIAIVQELIEFLLWKECSNRFAMGTIRKGETTTDPDGDTDVTIYLWSIGSARRGALRLSRNLRESPMSPGPREYPFPPLFLWTRPNFCSVRKIEKALLLWMPTCEEISIRLMWGDAAPARQNNTWEACSTAGTIYRSFVFFS